MWPRKRPDIRWSDLLYGVFAGLKPRPPSVASVVSRWFPTDEAILCLSVRSGLDLLLQALSLPRGSEVVVSSVTLPDMLCIIEHHGLVPVAVAIAPQQLAPSANDLARAITEKSRLVLLAHLFGGRIEMTPMVRVARQHGLLIVEDCAQGFVGPQYSGHPKTDVAMFSFGPIKTSTALGGAVLRVGDRELCNRMQNIQASYVRQRRWRYWMRTGKYAALKFLSNPMQYGALVGFLRRLNLDHDQLVRKWGRSFAGVSLLPEIRKQPCNALQWLLRRRIQSFDYARLDRRQKLGRFLARTTSCDTCQCLGASNTANTFWVAAIQTDQPKRLTQTIRDAGFDATRHSSMCDAQRWKSPTAVSSTKTWLDEVVFVPCDPDMPASAVWKLRKTIERFCAIDTTTCKAECAEKR